MAKRWFLHGGYWAPVCDGIGVAVPLSEDVIAPFLLEPGHGRGLDTHHHGRRERCPVDYAT